MDLSDVWSPRINTIINSTVSQSIGCVGGDDFDWQALDLVAGQSDINFERDGLAILLAAAAQMATVVTMYAEDMGVSPTVMHAQFVDGMREGASRVGDDSEEE